MCGINGIVRFDGPDVGEADLHAMNGAVAYRGPDDSGVFVDRHVGLGHLRLAIIDLSPAGHQPMRYTHRGRTAILVYNGEIYNFAQIRARLEGLGYAFQSKSDTEVILAAYIEYGVDCVREFNGMFAFVLYDVERNVLFGARDRFGEKPFKYYLDDTRMIFSSELKAILAGGAPRELDPHAVDAFLTLQYVPAPATGFKGIRKLPHAHYFVLDIATRAFTVTRYFDLDYSAKVQATEGEWLERIDAAFRTAVRRRLIADVPLGLFLSGGLDSSMVAAAMTRLTGDVRTFSIGFGESEYDESRHAETVAKALGTRHTTFHVRAEDLPGELEGLVYQYEEPFADNSQFPTLLLSRLTRQHVTVALSGDAGDENFAGYEKHRLHVLLKRYRLLLQFARPLAPVVGLGSSREALDRLAIVLRTINDPIVTRHFNYTSFFDPVTKQTFYTAAFRDSLGAPGPNPFAEVLGARRFDDIDEVLYVDFNSYLPDDLNVKVDIASMRSSLEVRAPMLDHEFAALTASIPWPLKVDAESGKKIFKALAERYLPRDIIYRRKHGFGVPVSTWLRGELKDLARRAIFDEQGLVLQIMRREKVEALFEEHQRGRNHGTRLWALLVLNLWHRAYFVDRR